MGTEREKKVTAPARAGPAPLEAWSRATFVLGALAAALFVLLGLRPGGALPVLVYRWGMLALSALALFGLLAALGWSVLHRPLLQRRRWIPFAILAGTLWATSLPFPYPSSHEGHPSALTFALPLDPPALVLFAGERPDRDPLALDPARRFGLVLEGEADGATLRSPAAGRVLERAEVERRLAPLGLAGERLRIAVGGREVLVLEGLAPDAAVPGAGAELCAGDVLGRLAGRRLGLFLVDSPDLERGEGIPMRFSLPGGTGRQALSVGPLAARAGPGEARR
jgi:hypothetical protein